MSCRIQVAIITALFFTVFFKISYAVHDNFTKGGCLECHYRLPFENKTLTFNEGVKDICAGCHITMGRSHPVDTAPSMIIPKDMPLTIRGTITCITCHTFHSGDKNAEDRSTFF